MPTALHVAARVAIHRGPAAGAARGCTRVSSRKARGLRRRREDRAHAPDGRDAAARLAGARRLGAADRARHRARRGRQRGARRARARRHRGRHGPQPPGRLSGARDRGPLAARPASRSARRATTSRRRPRATPRSRRAARCAPSRSRSSRSRATSACSASGPRCGLGELRLPALQPGSSIMPGKVNPVICESVTQVAAQVIGHDAAIAVAGLSGQLQLNAFLPLIARNLLESVRLLANVSNLFVERCLEGLEVDRERASALGRGQPRAGDRAGARDRLRRRRADREAVRRDGQDRARGLPRAARAAARGARAAARPAPQTEPDARRSRGSPASGARRRGGAAGEGGWATRCSPFCFEPFRRACRRGRSANGCA